MNTAQAGGKSYDWRDRADTYRPADPTELAAEIRRQAAGGLRPRDIAALMRLPLATVLEALRDQEQAA
jgi:hypothetical protein